MTICSQQHDPHEAPEETHMRWLYKYDFPAMRQDLASGSCKDVPMLRSVPTGDPLGTFQAVSTRDGEALARHGHAFYALNSLKTSADCDAVVEILFADGLWMLATDADLEMSGPTT